MHDELTKKDIEKMEAEIEHRKLVVRKEALEDVKEARAQGDLSENFEYKAAKKFKNENESRIRYLEKMIKTAVIVSEDSPEDEVGMNNTVDIYFEEDDVTETYKLVTTVRSNSLKNLISRESPLGAAIFGHKAGDRCEVHVNDNYSYFVQIKRIVKEQQCVCLVEPFFNGGSTRNSCRCFQRSQLLSIFPEGNNLTDVSFSHQLFVTQKYFDIRGKRKTRKSHRMILSSFKRYPNSCSTHIS